MRTAVAGLSPLIPEIEQTYDLSTFAISLLGAIAPLSFAVGGIITPRIEKRIGLERTLILAVLLMVIGHVLRAISPDWNVLAWGTLAALMGMGIGNVAMPPTVRKYFPDRVSFMTAVYMSVMSAGAFLPPLIAVPVAEALSWRESLGQWAIIAVIALIPWIAEYIKHRNDPLDEIPDSSSLTKTAKPWRSATAWAVGLTLAVSSVTGYAMFAWLPVILIDIAGVTPIESGALLSLFSLLGLPLALFIPGLATKMKKHVHWLVWSASVLFGVGYLGMLLLPTQATWLWVSIVGIGCLEFPLAMVLMNLRTESEKSSMSLSGFAQMVAYMFAAMAPPLMGISHEITQSWDASLVGLFTFSIAINIPVALILMRNRTMDEELKNYSSSHRSAR